MERDAGRAAWPAVCNAEWRRGATWFFSLRYRAKTSRQQARVGEGAATQHLYPAPLPTASSDQNVSWI
ncbi:protein of unknown function [Paraburkholderia kururiensis]